MNIALKFVTLLAFLICNNEFEGKNEQLKFDVILTGWDFSN